MEGKTKAKQVAGTRSILLPLVVVVILGSFIVVGQCLAAAAAAQESAEGSRANGGGSEEGGALMKRPLDGAAMAAAAAVDQPPPASETGSRGSPAAAAAESGDDDGGEQQTADPALLPKDSSLFAKDAVDKEMLGQMDCHLRNTDLCYAGLIGTSSKILPETEAELEARCDEAKAATTCVAHYNKRCSTMKVMSMLMPLANYQDRASALPEAADERLDGAVAIGNKLLGAADRPSAPKISARDWMSVCEPAAKGTKANKALRERLLAIGKCINPRMGSLGPCVDDLKTALQLFYEPTRSLPLEPTCCAVSRFRHCASGVMNNVCGLSSVEQLAASLPSGSGSMFKSMERICRRGIRFDSAFCVEVLPPSGMRAPQRRGKQASKLAKLLELFSMAPSTQQQ